MQIHMYDQWKCPKTDSDLDTPWCVEDRRDLLLNFESPVTDLLLSNLKSPVTDGITDISNSPDWYYLVFFPLHSISDRFKALQLCGFGGRSGQGIRKFPSFSYHFLVINLSVLIETMELIPICPLLITGHTGKEILACFQLQWFIYVFTGHYGNL